MKRGEWRLVRISTQTVVFVVLCEFTQCLFNSDLYLWEGSELGRDAQVVCVDEAPSSIMEWLIIGVYVEELGREHSPVVGHSSAVSI